jgi:hypothetical protein
VIDFILDTEEVDGSNPFEPTIIFNHLDKASVRSAGHFCGGLCRALRSPPEFSQGGIGCIVDAVTRFTPAHCNRRLR